MINRPQLRPDKNRDAHWECNEQDNEKTLKTGKKRRKLSKEELSLSFVASSVMLEAENCQRENNIHLSNSESMQELIGRCCKTLIIFWSAKPSQHEERITYHDASKRNPSCC